LLLLQCGREFTDGFWGQRWIETSSSLKKQNLDVSLLMWDMRRNLNPSPLPKKRTVINFLYPELPASKRSWWLVVEADGDVDLCWADPGFEVDLYVSTDLRTMTAIWMGLTTVAREKDKVSLTGDRAIANTMRDWLGLSPFAIERKRGPTLVADLAAESLANQRSAAYRAHASTFPCCSLYSAATSSRSVLAENRLEFFCDTLKRSEIRSVNR
jgi:hypothetical protein